MSYEQWSFFVMVYGVLPFAAVFSVSILNRHPLVKSIRIAFFAALISFMVAPLNVLFSFKHWGIFSSLTMNWGGQIAMTVTAILILLSLGKSGIEAAGLKRRATKSSYGLAVVVGLLIYLASYLLTSPMTAQAEHFGQQLAFEASMPGVSEELIYRGILLSLLNAHFGRPLHFLGMQLGWGVVLVSAPFALGHVIRPGHGLSDVSEGLATGVFTFLASVLLCFLREKTKSLWPCMLAHNIANTIELLISKFLLVT